MMAEIMPRVSVIMPAFNADRFLREAIESILGQTFRDFEFLIYDDGSTDDTNAIAREYGLKDARIRVITAENGGICLALNRMIGEAQGDYIARMDADDISLPDRFAQQVAFLDAHPDHVVIDGQRELMDEDGFVLGPNWKPTRHETIDANNLQGRTSMTHPAVMLRSAALSRVGGYDKCLEYSEDLDLWLRLAEVGKLANLRTIVLRYRLNYNGISGSKADHQKANARRSCEAAAARRQVTVTFVEGKGLHPPQTWELFLKYARMAWDNNQRDTWRRYIFKAFRAAPLNRRVLRAGLIGMVRRPAGMQNVIAPDI